MIDRLRARELFEELGERLELRWLAGQRGGERVLERGEHLSRRPSLAGYLNVIHPNKVQIIGSAELSWLDGLDARTRWEVLQKVMESRPLAMVITEAGPVPPPTHIHLRGSAHAEGDVVTPECAVSPYLLAEGHFAERLRDAVGEEHRGQRELRNERHVQLSSWERHFGRRFL